MAEGEDGVDRMRNTELNVFQFRQLCKFRVSKRPTDLPKRRFSLLAVSTEYGLTFIGDGTGFSVYRTLYFLDKDKELSRLSSQSTRLNQVVTDCPSLARVDVGQEVSHVALSLGDKTIAIATTSQLGVAIHLYDINNFEERVTGNVTPFHSFTENVPGPIKDLSFLTQNQLHQDTLAVVYSNGQIDVFNVTDKLRRASLPSAEANCLSCSRYDKQLVVGRKDGALMQYDYDLNEKRRWNRPPQLTHDMEAIDIVCLCTDSFMVAFAPPSLDITQPCVMQIDGSREGPIQYSILKDVCFETGEDREAKYHFIFICHLSLVVAASNNSTEVGVVGQHLDGSSWERWSLDDSHRAECPLTDEFVDTFPLGFAADHSYSLYSGVILMLLTTDGLLIPYHMLYLPTAEGLRLPGCKDVAKFHRSSTKLGATSSSQATAADLIVENLHLKQRLKCVKCKENDYNICLLYCYHLSLCEECAQNVTHCPVCRRMVQDKVKTFLA